MLYEDKMEKSLLLVIDVQNGFVSKKTRHVVPRIVQLLSSSKFGKVAFTQYFNAESSPYEKYLQWFELKTDEEQALAKEIEPYARLIFRKDVYTAINSEVRTFLEREKIGTVYLVGIDTDCCVLATAVDLFQMGIRPIVLADYCASNGGHESHAAGLRVLVRLIGAGQIHLEKL
jgi:nicotinamidase-related amidase